MTQKPPSLDELKLQINLCHDFAITLSEKSSKDFVDEMVKALE